MFTTKKRDWIDWTVVMMSFIAFIICILTLAFVDGEGIHNGLAAISWTDIVFSVIIAGLVFLFGVLIKKLINKETKEALKENQASTSDRLNNVEKLVRSTNDLKVSQVERQDKLIEIIIKLHNNQTSLSVQGQTGNQGEANKCVKEINKLIAELHHMKVEK